MKKKSDPFSFELPDWVSDAKNFDGVLGLDNDMMDGFNIISDQFKDIGLEDRPRRTNNRRKFSIDRQERLSSGQEALTPDESYNAGGGRDFFGAPNSEY